MPFTIDDGYLYRLRFVEGMKGVTPLLRTISPKSPPETIKSADAVVAWTLGSPACSAVLAMQDVLGLGASARMNTPGEPLGQWRWRMRPEAWGAEAADRLRERVEFAGRLRPTG